MKPRFAILCHDLSSVRLINDAAARLFEPVFARDPQGLLALLGEDAVPAVVMIDNGVVQTNAIELLEMVRCKAPASRRVLLTEHCDLSVIVQGLHTGAVERIVYKPIYGPELLAAIATPAMQTALSALGPRGVSAPGSQRYSGTRAAG